MGLEPTTFGLKVRTPGLAHLLIAWLEHISVLTTHWLCTRAAASRQSLPHELRGLARLTVPEPAPPMIPAHRDPSVGRLPLD
ncbi:hypothetical protein CWT12_01475 [Actinomyces sp. 432]|uniref:hypothetical protein n=1 Tax=Actinomyces sp. 432 TaxID=2057798 RepID=UPI0013742601|nr:hypothetical protein [Actinomyces sp. 432]QHO90272.1 hypothetical protein CWT12_01475 [Actinomyces sp. 432]